MKNSAMIEVQVRRGADGIVAEVLHGAGANADHISLAMRTYDEGDGGTQTIAVTRARVGSFYRAMLVDWAPE